MNEKLINRVLLPALGCVIMVSLVACSSADTNNNAQTATINSTIAPTTQVQAGSVNSSMVAFTSQAPATNPKQSDIALHVIADGSLSFVEHGKLTFRTSGIVGQVNVKELDKVTKGHVLAKLDTTSLEQAVRAAELGVKAVELAQESAHMDLKQAEYGVNAAEADLKQLQNNVKSATIDLEQATDNFRKISYPYNYHTLVLDVPEALGFMKDASREVTDALQTGLSAYEVSRKLKDALDNLTKSRELLARHGYGDDVFASGYLSIDKFWTLRAAQLQVDKVQLALESAQNVVSKSALTVDNAKTTLNKAQVAADKVSNDTLIAENNLNVAKTNLENAIITAPFDGVVAKVNVKEGDYLSPGNYATTIAVEIIDPSRMELNVEVYELDIPNVALGQKVAISVDALPDERFDGVVTSIGSLPSSATGVVSYEVKIAFDVPQDSALKTGMGATADITVEKR